MATPFFFHWWVKGPVPLAVTENVAVCPAVTVWFAGCNVTIGATRAEVFAPETNPEHPVVVSATTTNKIKPQRFIVSLSRNFPRCEVGWDEEEQLAGEQPLKFCNY